MGQGDSGALRRVAFLPRRALIPAAAVAAVMYSNFVLDWVLRGFSGMDVVVSYLESPGQPNATFLRITDVVGAALVLLVLPAFLAALPAGRARTVVAWSVVVFAVGIVAAAIWATPCTPDHPCTTAAERFDRDVHDVTSVLSELGLFLSAAATAIAVRSTGPTWLRRAGWWVFWLGGVVLNLLFAWYGEISGAPGADALAGYVQRLHIVSVSFWILCMGIHAATDHPREREPVQP